MFALEDINVLALESGVSAPLCTRLLGDLGAEVVKVERPGTGDVHRHWDSSVYGTSTAHVWLDRNKRSIELDLKNDDGRSVFLDLAAKADVVVQNFSPGVVERLGIGYDDVIQRNPEVVYLNLSGFGRSGPYRDRKVYDLVMQGEAGLILMNGSPDYPAKIPLSICDINASMYGALSVLAVLFNRSQTGNGREIDVNMFSGMLDWLGYFPLQYWYDDDLPGRTGMRHHLITPYGPHRTSDDQYINLAVLSEAHWRTFCLDVIERGDLLEDSRFDTNEKRIENRGVFEPIVEDVIASKPRDYWAERLDKAGIPWGDVNRLDEVLRHPQTEHLEMVRQLDTDRGPVKYIDNPVDIEGLEMRRERMPGLGEHTESVLVDLGYSREEIDRLANEGVI